MAEEYEELNKDIKTCMHEAEEKCRQLHTLEVHWSSAYKRLCLTLLYWYMRKYYSLN